MPAPPQGVFLRRDNLRKAFDHFDFEGKGHISAADLLQVKQLRVLLGLPIIGSTKYVFRNHAFLPLAYGFNVAGVFFIVESPCPSFEACCTYLLY